MNDFARMLTECRTRFTAGRAGLRRLLGLSKPPTYDSRDDVPATLQPHYQTLLEIGTVVWGALAQVNMHPFNPGPDDQPGVTVYSTDSRYDENPRDLTDIAGALFVLKNTEPSDPIFQPVATIMTNEYDRTPRLTLPMQLTDGRRVFAGLTIFHRSRLPSGVVSSRLLPLVVSPERTEANMILPLPYWSDLLRTRWRTLDERCSQLPLNSTARQVALAAEKRPVTAPLAASKDGPPVRLTPAAAKAIRDQLAEQGITQEAYLCIGTYTEGEMRGRDYADLAPTYDPASECCFESSGISVVVRLDQLDQFRGTVVDFQDTLYGAGFTINKPND